MAIVCIKAGTSTGTHLGLYLKISNDICTVDEIDRFIVHVNALYRLLDL
jgi:hypothetical protein